MTPDSPRPGDQGAPGGANGAGTDAPTDADDWWDGTVDLAPPAEDPPGIPAPVAADTPGTSAASGDEAAASGASSGSSPLRWLLGTAAVVVAAGVGLGLLATRGGDSSQPAADGSGSGRNGPGRGPGGFGPGTSGTITDVDADTLTLAVETSSGDTVDVSATADTTISETVEGTVGDLSVGDSVLVVGAAPEDGGTVAAEQVVASSDGDLLGGAGSPRVGGFPTGDDLPQRPEGDFPEGTPPGDGEPPEGFDPQQGGPGGAGGPGGGQPGGGFVTGTIESVDDGSLAVRTAEDGTVTVTMSSETTVQVSRALSFDDLAAGDEVTVTGEADGDTVAAQAIRRGDVGVGFPGSSAPPGDGAPSDEASDDATT